MKYLCSLCFMILLVASSVTFAGETTTDCPMMKEMNKRNNPKSSLSSDKLNNSKSKSGVVAQ
jgi:hypothetical protein